MYNLTTPFDPEAINEAVVTLSALFLPLRAVVNTELQELAILCNERHAENVERIFCIIHIMAATA